MSFGGLTDCPCLLPYAAQTYENKFFSFKDCLEVPDDLPRQALLQHVPGAKGGGRWFPLSAPRRPVPLLPAGAADAPQRPSMRGKGRGSRPSHLDDGTAQHSEDSRRPQPSARRLQAAPPPAAPSGSAIAVDSDGGGGGGSTTGTASTCTAPRRMSTCGGPSAPAAAAAAATSALMSPVYQSSDSESDSERRDQQEAASPGSAAPGSADLAAAAVTESAAASEVQEAGRRQGRGSKGGRGPAGVRRVPVPSSGDGVPGLVPGPLPPRRGRAAAVGHLQAPLLPSQRGKAATTSHTPPEVIDVSKSSSSSDGAVTGEDGGAMTEGGGGAVKERGGGAVTKGGPSASPPAQSRVGKGRSKGAEQRGRAHVPPGYLRGGAYVFVRARTGDVAMVVPRWREGRVLPTLPGAGLVWAKCLCGSCNGFT